MIIYPVAGLGFRIGVPSMESDGIVGMSTVLLFRVAASLSESLHPSPSAEPVPDPWFPLAAPLSLPATLSVCSFLSDFWSFSLVTPLLAGDRKELIKTNV